MTALTAREEELLRNALRDIAQKTPTAPATTQRPRALRRRAAARWMVAAALVALAGGGAVLVLRHGSTPAPTHQAIASPSVGPSTPASITPGLGSVVVYDLARLLRESRRVVLGRVVEVRHGDGAQAGGIPYVLALVQVTEALRGGSSNVWAFDYDVGNGTAIPSVPTGPRWETGENVLLFLAPSTGTVHEGLTPTHDQVVGGPQGRYQVKAGELVGAPFTLEQVRSQTR